MGAQRFFVVIQEALHPLKQWLRTNPDRVPPGVHPDTHTTHQIRTALKKQGWTVRDNPDQCLVIPPGEATEVQSALAESIEPAGSETLEECAFPLEYHLRDFIARHLTTLAIGGKQLRIFSDKGGQRGVEYPTGVGPIDILAVDAEGNLFVFELKLDRGPDKAIGQLSRYMGWVKKNLADGKSVFGVVVAKTVDEKLRYAASVIPNLFLFEYEVDFRLADASAIVN